MRRLIAGIVLVGLAIGIWLLWPRATSSDTATTTDLGVTATTTSSTQPSAPPPVTPEPSTTTTEESHVVETTEEAEAVLRKLWFGWFEGIYNQDEDRIREVVATQHQLSLAVDQFDQMEFSSAPEPEDIRYWNSETLRADGDCLAVFTTTDLTGFSTGSSSDVHVLRWTGTRWGIFSLWKFKDDLWENDCTASLE